MILSWRTYHIFIYIYTIFFFSYDCNEGWSVIISPCERDSWLWHYFKVIWYSYLTVLHIEKKIKNYTPHGYPDRHPRCKKQFDCNLIRFIWVLLFSWFGKLVPDCHWALEFYIHNLCQYSLGIILYTIWAIKLFTISVKIIWTQAKPE